MRQVSVRTPHLLSFLLVLVSLVFLVRPAAAQQSEEFEIKQGLFHSGDAQNAAALHFDDSQWRHTKLPCPFSECDLAASENIVWYRLRFNIDDPTSQDWAVYPGRLWGAEEVYLNGELLGRKGVIAPRYAEVWELARFYPLARERLQVGENVLAFRMMDNGIIPGLSLDPVIVGNRALLAQQSGRVQKDLAWKNGAMFAFAATLLILWLAAFVAGIRDFWSNILGLILLLMTNSWVLTQIVLEPTPLSTFIETLSFVSLTVPASSLFPFALMRSQNRWIWLGVLALSLISAASLSLSSSLETNLLIGTVVSGCSGVVFLIGTYVGVQHFVHSERKMLIVLLACSFRRPSRN